MESDGACSSGRADGGLEGHRKALEIMEPLSSANPANLLWQSDVVEFNRDLAINGDDPIRRFTLIRATLRQMQTHTKLTDEQRMWLSEAETLLAKLADSK
jgi:hypothetical protein